MVFFRSAIESPVLKTFRELRIQSEEEFSTPTKTLAVSDNVKAIFRKANATDPTKAGRDWVHVVVGVFKSILRVSFRLRSKNRGLVVLERIGHDKSGGLDIFPVSIKAVKGALRSEQGSKKDKSKVPTSSRASTRPSPHALSTSISGIMTAHVQRPQDPILLVLFRANPARGIQARGLGECMSLLTTAKLLLPGSDPAYLREICGITPLVEATKCEDVAIDGDTEIVRDDEDDEDGDEVEDEQDKAVMRPEIQISRLFSLADPHSDVLRAQNSPSDNVGTHAIERPPIPKDKNIRNLRLSQEEYDRAQSRKRDTSSSTGGNFLEDGEDALVLEIVAEFDDIKEFFKEVNASSQDWIEMPFSIFDSLWWIMERLEKIIRVPVAYWVLSQAEALTQDMMNRLIGEQMDAYLSNLRDAVIVALSGETGLKEGEWEKIADSISVLSRDVQDSYVKYDVQDADVISRIHSPMSPRSVDVHFIFHYRMHYKHVAWYYSLGFRVNDKPISCITSHPVQDVQHPHRTDGWTPFDWFSLDKRRNESSQCSITRADLKRVHDALFGQDSEAGGLGARVSLRTTAELILASVGIAFEIAMNEEEAARGDDGYMGNDGEQHAALSLESEKPGFSAAHLRKICGILPLAGDDISDRTKVQVSMMNNFDHADEWEDYPDSDDSAWEDERSDDDRSVDDEEDNY
ncbi:hypothetical protein HETIRDRAFT_120344 [Heterobasidion irregulare TC 32-1]|uniref:Uncharacterized protein n=1 Tax=Heterobasidion irregulare (strain TC 32-1) TaxID=747525 RepID=W4JNZ9_HETIT|nr:uncharacterized protein HETIRDRAFT_120344 [Heterobasidion irregulare TC 32-1]ETW75219.1 hypothetical protein HETIRDRAFT_120344 [Heterobasidion irregulare TC 32-1]